MQWTMYDHEGQRKYLTASEVRAFLSKARNSEIDVYSFCWMMAVTGCRISEALSLTEKSIDFESGHVIIRSLKKRGKQIFRAVPLPTEFLNQLRSWLSSGALARERLWPWSRMTGYRRICEVMRAAGICGSYASPKGLRHSFGVRAIQASVPLTLVQRWLGHADIKTTAIYTSAMGPEEREIASRMWRESNAFSRPRAGASQPKPPTRSEGGAAKRPAVEPALRPCRVAKGPGTPPPRPSLPKLTKVVMSAPVSRLRDLLCCPMLQFWLKRLQESYDFSST
jgi:hypothetical protein